MAKMFKCDICGKILSLEYGYSLEFSNFEMDITYIGDRKKYDVCAVCREEICKFIRDYKKEGK